MKKEIEIKPKKPKLAYVGMDKKTLAEVVPTQVVEVVYPSKVEKKDEETLFAKGELRAKIIKSSDLPKNRLIWTNDNLIALKTLLDEKDPISGEYRYRNKIDLIYIDPPFMVQSDFVAENSIDIEVDEEEGVMSVKEPTIIETIAYKDTWQNGLDSFLQMMRERLLLMKGLLVLTGSIYVHLDWHASHYIKVLMDEVFDYQLFRNEIIWKKYSGVKNQASKKLTTQTDTILWYSNTDEINFSQQYRPMSEEYVKGEYKYIDESGRRYAKIRGRGYQGPKGEQNIKYLDENPGSPITSLWDEDGLQLNTSSAERTGYPTQKPVELLKRIIRMSCPQNGLILDAFMGSGTTCEAAEQLAGELNCSWIGIDNSKFAIHTARKRLIELNSKPKAEKNAGGL